MTFPRSCALFAVVLAASLAAARQPRATPSADPLVYDAPQPPPTAYPSPPQPYLYYAVPPAAALQLPPPSWALSVSGGELRIESADGAGATCGGLTIPVEGHAAVEVTVEGKHVHVRSVASPCAGKCARPAPRDSLRGSALRVTRGGPKGCVLTLEGDATLALARKGKKAELTAERIVVNLATGQVEGQIGCPPQSQPPATPVAPRTGASEPPATVPVTSSPPPTPAPRR